MFFVLSKILNSFILPLTIVFIILVLSIVLRNPVWKKRLQYSGVILLFLFSNDFLANEAILAWEIKPIAYKDMAPYKLGIVLTGTTIPGLEPNDRIYFSRGADRVTHTVELYKKGLVGTILISGGTGR